MAIVAKNDTKVINAHDQLITQGSEQKVVLKHYFPEALENSLDVANLGIHPWILKRVLQETKKSLQGEAQVKSAESESKPFSREAWLFQRDGFCGRSRVERQKDTIRLEGTP